MNIAASIALFSLASMFTTVDALVVEPTLVARGRYHRPTTTGVAATGTSTAGAGNQGFKLDIWWYPIIAIAVIGVVIGIIIVILRVCCSMACNCCLSLDRNKKVPQKKQNIVPVHEQPQAHNPMWPFAPDGSYIGPYDPHMEQHKAESYPLTYTPMSAQTPVPHSSRVSFETGTTANYQPNQHPYNASQQFQGR